MTYTPNTPANGAENISVSQPKITTNFQQLNTLFDRDHYAWNDLTSSNRALHRQITFPAPLVADPGTSTNRGSFYTKADVNDTSARPQLYFENINGVNAVQQITNRFKDASAQGYWMLPNGSPNQPSLILMWGFNTGPFSSGSSTLITFPQVITNYVYPGLPATGFPNNCFNVQITMEVGDNDTKTVNLSSTSITRTGFRVRANVTTFNAVYWFAIGN